ncbi:MAG: hypothetical protein JEZ05_05945 [Tenericutes bacterium]|nr:hypothetical protein [Mycoplasmatota bacterium]
MEKIVKEYNSWLKENQNFILHLKNHDSSLYTRIMPLYEVLNFFSSESEENGLEFNDDIVKIFQVGLEYFHSQVDVCKIYLEKVFKKDFHAFLKYDMVIGYILYLEDLRYEIKENKLKLNEEKINELTDYLENIMDTLQAVPDTINLYIDSEVHKIIDVSKLNFHSIIDIFVDIAETLEINLYSESEFVIGEDI